MRKHLLTAGLTLVLLGLVPLLSLAQAPTPTPVQSGFVFSVTMPTMETGAAYNTLLTGTNNILSPLDDFAAEIASYSPGDPVLMATEAVNNINIVWQYASVFSNVLPGLVSVTGLIVFFLVVKILIVIISAVRYLKQLIAQWV